MCHLTKLDLILCSESIKTVSISGEYCLSTPGKSKFSFLVKYAKRDTAKWNDTSLHLYSHYTKNSESSRQWNSQEYFIPHYVGARSVPIYPPTQGYAKSVLILHVPWKNTFNKQKETRDYVNEFRHFLKSPFCPVSVQIGYERAKARYQKRNNLLNQLEKK